MQKCSGSRLEAGSRRMVQMGHERNAIQYNDSSGSGGSNMPNGEEGDLGYSSTCSYCFVFWCGRKKVLWKDGFCLFHVSGP